MSIKGLNNLERKFRQLRDINIKPIIEDASARVRDEARKNVRVDTGELQNSITYRLEDKGNGNWRGVIFTNKEHGIYVEFGTGPVGEANHIGISREIKPMYSPSPWVYYDKDKKQFFYTHGQPAKPFLYPALHDNKDKIKKFIKYRIKKELREASK